MKDENDLKAKIEIRKRKTIIEEDGIFRSASATDREMVLQFSGRNLNG
jgi:hypothetical protein